MGSQAIKRLKVFAAEGAKENEIIFCRGVYLAENTAQAASVEFVRQRRTNYARGRLQNLAKKPEGIFRQTQIPSVRMGSFSVGFGKESLL